MNDNTNSLHTELQYFGTPATAPTKVRNKCTWAEEDMPHYKLQEKGKHSLTDRELLSMIIGDNPQIAVPLTTALLEHFNNNLNALFKSTAQDIMGLGVKGITPRMARLIVAVGELGRRRTLAPVKELPKITSSREAYDILYPHMIDMQVEQFMILTLNRANKVINTHVISLGGLTGTVADPRVILRHCLQDKSTGLILAHNHPSGNLKPSTPDLELTRKVKDGAGFMDISVHDHLIIGDGNYFSFADEGMM
jgi:DNA repair protein RadC